MNELLHLEHELLSLQIIQPSKHSKHNNPEI